LIDFRERICKPRKILLGEAVFRAAVRVHGELGRLCSRAADRERAIGFAAALEP